MVSQWILFNRTLINSRGVVVLIIGATVSTSHLVLYLGLEDEVGKVNPHPESVLLLLALLLLLLAFKLFIARLPFGHLLSPMLLLLTVLLLFPLFVLLKFPRFQFLLVVKMSGVRSGLQCMSSRHCSINSLLTQYGFSGGPSLLSSPDGQFDITGGTFNAVGGSLVMVRVNLNGCRSGHALFAKSCSSFNSLISEGRRSDRFNNF